MGATVYQLYACFFELQSLTVGNLIKMLTNLFWSQKKPCTLRKTIHKQQILLAVLSCILEWCWRRHLYSAGSNSKSQQTWLQSRNRNPSLPEAGVSISNSSSFGYWSALLSSTLILSRLLTLSSATQSQMLTIAEHLKISQSQWGEFNSRKHNVWKNRKKKWGCGISNQVEFEKEEREGLVFYSSCLTTSSFSILWTSSAKTYSERHWSNPEKTSYYWTLKEYKAQ